MHVKVRARVSVKLWHLLLILILFSIIGGRLLLSDAMFGNNVFPNGGLAKAPQQLPAQFRVRHVAIALGSLGHRFNVETERNPNLGRIDENFFSWGRSFFFYNSAGERTAVSHEIPFSWGTQIEVFGPDGTTKIATLQEQVFQSVLKLFTVYRIVGVDGQLIGESEKVDAWDTDFTLKDPSGQTVISMHRPWVNWPTDEWTITVYKIGLDPRLAEAIVVNKSAADADNSDSRDSSDDTKSSGSKSH